MWKSINSGTKTRFKPTRKVKDEETGELEMQDSKTRRPLEKGTDVQKETIAPQKGPKKKHLSTVDEQCLKL